MKKNLFFIICLIGFFSFSQQFVFAQGIDIVCGNNECEKMSFQIVQLTNSNVKYNQKYEDYSSYFQENFQSTRACLFLSKTNNCVSLENEYIFDMQWSTSQGFSAYSSNGFVNLSDGIGTTSSYIKAGTYVFLLKNVGESVELDLTEYIIYVNVKSDLSIGSFIVQKIKDSDGSVISSIKVDTISYKNMNVYTTNIFDEEVDFYLINSLSGLYADLSKIVYYHMSVDRKNNEPITAYIYDKNGCVKSGSSCITFTFSNDNEINNIGLKNGQALIFKKGSLKLGETIKFRVYLGLKNLGYSPLFSIYKDGNEAGEQSTSDGVEYIGELGSKGSNYANFVWNYPNSNVPETGLDSNIEPFFIVTLFMILFLIILIFMDRKKVYS